MIKFGAFLKTDYCRKLKTNNSCIIICTGTTIKTYSDKIQNFINKNNLIVFAVNQYPDFFSIDPSLHLFTNNHRWQEISCSVRKMSKLMLGCHIKKLPADNDYIKIKYTDRVVNEKMSYNNSVIFGYYRSVGTLAIMIAHMIGFKNIYVVGMDGHSLTEKYIHYYKDPEDSFYKNVNIEHRKLFNPAMGIVLDNLKDFGIKFSIITPTLFSKHYKEKFL